MTMYQPNIPTGSVPLNEDYKNLQDNFTQINTTYNTDHVPLTTASQNGYHTVIHLVKQSSDPAGITNTFSLYEKSTSDGFATKQQLFAISGTSPPYPLTRNFVPSVTSGGKGATFLPGGFVLEWGSVAGPFASSASGSENFSLAFPNNVFSVTLQLVGKTPATGSSDNSLFLLDNYTLSLFNWKYNGGSNDFTSFFWMAIGN